MRDILPLLLVLTVPLTACQTAPEEPEHHVREAGLTEDDDDNPPVPDGACESGELARYGSFACKMGPLAIISETIPAADANPMPGCGNTGLLSCDWYFELKCGAPLSAPSLPDDWCGFTPWTYPSGGSGPATTDGYLASTGSQCVGTAEKTVGRWRVKIMTFANKQACQDFAAGKTCAQLFPNQPKDHKPFVVADCGEPEPPRADATCCYEQPQGAVFGYADDGAGGAGGAGASTSEASTGTGGVGGSGGSDTSTDQEIPGTDGTAGYGGGEASADPAIPGAGGAASSDGVGESANPARSGQ